MKNSLILSSALAVACAVSAQAQEFGGELSFRRDGGDGYVFNSGVGALTLRFDNGLLFQLNGEAGDYENDDYPFTDQVIHIGYQVSDALRVGAFYGEDSYDGVWYYRQGIEGVFDGDGFGLGASYADYIRTTDTYSILTLRGSYDITDSLTANVRYSTTDDDGDIATTVTVGGRYTFSSPVSSSGVAYFAEFDWFSTDDDGYKYDGIRLQLGMTFGNGRLFDNNSWMTATPLY